MFVGFVLGLFVVALVVVVVTSDGFRDPRSYRYWRRKK
jgi:hypothetical protein